MAGFFIAPNYSSVQEFTFSIPSIPVSTNTTIQTNATSLQSNEDSQQKIQQLQNELTRIRSEADSLRVQQKKIQNNANLSVQQKNQELQKIQNEMTQLRKQYETNKAELEQTKQKYRLPVEISQQRIIKLEKELNDSRKEKKNIQQEKEKVNQNIVNLQSQLNNKKQQYNQNQTTITQLRTNLTQVRENTREKNNLQSQLNNALRTKQETNTQIQNLREQLQKEQETKQQVAQQATQEKATSNAIKKQLADLQKQLEQQQIQLEQADSARKKQEALINTWRNTLGVEKGATSNQIKKAIQTLKTNKNRVQELQQLQNNLRSSLDLAENQSIQNALTQKLEELNQLSQAQSNLNKLKNALRKQYSMSENSSLNNLIASINTAERTRREAQEKEKREAKKAECKLKLTKFKQELQRKLDTFKRIEDKYNTKPDEIKQQLTLQHNELQTIQQAYFGLLKKFNNNNNIQTLNNLNKNNIQNSICESKIIIPDIEELNTRYGTELANINEDIAGSVRVYVRVKKLPSENADSVVQNTTAHDISIACSGMIIQEGGQEVFFNASSKLPPNIFKNFYGVFPSSYNNRSVFRGLEVNTEIPRNLTKNTDDGRGIYRIFHQLASGYNAVLFGYGLSGSGKTYTLLGSGKETPGVVQLGLEYATKTLGATQIEVKYVFEQYVDYVRATGESIFSYMRGTLIPLYGNEVVKTLFNNVIKGGDTKKPYQMNSFIKNDKTIQNSKNPYRVSFPTTNQDFNEKFNQFIQVINQHREQKGRIKATPNNQESSRSHLYIVLQITFPNNITSYLTIVDMAGKESPQGIFNTFKDKNFTKPDDYNQGKWNAMTNKIQSANIFQTQTTLGGYLSQLFSQGKTLDKEYPYQVIKEGIYINETLNHLKWYFKKKNGITEKFKINRSVSEYSPDNYMASPEQEENYRYFYDNINTEMKSITKKSKTIKVHTDPHFDALMVPILQWLDTKLSAPTNAKQSYKPTKFVMFCTVRTEEAFCNQTLETLKFADSIKST
jgi:hypothetical protein